MFRYLTVTAATSDAAVVTCTDGSTSRDIPCLASYRDRTVGDRVLVVQLEGGSWCVLGKRGAESDLTTP